jgi:hypothetical protein
MAVRRWLRLVMGGDEGSVPASVVVRREAAAGS